MFKKILLIATFILFSNLVIANTTLVWDKKPLDIVLPTDKQIFITFPDTARLMLPTSLDNKLDVQNSNNTVYLLSTEDFEPVQIKVNVQDQIIRINLSSQKKASIEPIDITFPKAPAPQKGAKNASFAMQEVSLQDLLRYSVQQYYAPKRLLENNPAIKLSMAFNNKTYKLYADDSITAIPLDSYTSNGVTVTGIYIKNNTDQEINLDPKNICGTWMASAYFPQSKLQGDGSKYDTSMLYLVSKSDFISTYTGTCGLEVK